MGFYGKDEPAQPTDDRSVVRTLSRARKPRPGNAIPPILTVGIGHRFYSPSFGRWLSRDPIGERGGVSLYAYVDNGPVIEIDAHGLQMKKPARKGTNEECLVELHLKHGTPPPKEIDERPPVEFTPCRRWGMFGCHADRYNKLVPPEFRIPGIPSVPDDQKWPPPDRRRRTDRDICKTVDDLIAVGKGLKQAIKELCDTGCCRNDQVQANVQIEKDMASNIDLARSLIKSGQCRGDVGDLPAQPPGGMVKCERK